MCEVALQKAVLPAQVYELPHDGLLCKQTSSSVQPEEPVGGGGEGEGGGGEGEGGGGEGEGGGESTEPDHEHP